MKRTLPLLALFLLMTPALAFAGETIVVESSDIAFDAVDKAELTEFTVTCSKDGCRIKSPMGAEALEILKDEVSRITGADVQLEEDETESETCNPNNGTDRGSRGKTDRKHKGNSAVGGILKEGAVEIVEELVTDRGSRGKTDRKQRGGSTGTILKEEGVEILQELFDQWIDKK